MRYWRRERPAVTVKSHFILPIMLGVMSAKWVADSITHSLYHAIIEQKCLPFLNPEITLHGVSDGELEKHEVSALLNEGSSVRKLKSGSESFLSCAELVSDSVHGTYPVVDQQDHFIGTIARTHIIAVLMAGVSGKPAEYLVSH